MAMALGFSQYGLAIEPNDCSNDFIVSVNVQDSTDDLTSFKEAWDFINTCPTDASYTIQFHNVFNNDEDNPLLLANAPFSLDDNRTVTLITDPNSDPAGTVYIQSSDTTKNLFTIKDGSTLVPQGVTIPTELIPCNAPFIVDTLLNDEYDGQTSFNEAWNYINENCNDPLSDNYDPDASDFSITFDSLFNEQTIVLDEAPYKINDGINIAINTGDVVTLSTVEADQVIFTQEEGAALDSNYETQEEDKIFELVGDNGATITITNVTIPEEDTQCASEFTINSRLVDPYDFEDSFQEVWTLISTECPGSTEYTINFDSSFSSQTLELTSAPYTVNDNRIINIAASTIDQLTLTDLETNGVDSTANNNFFTVENGSQLSLSGLILDGGQPVDLNESAIISNDPAIISAGSDAKLTINKVTFKGFYTTGDSKGAAISSSSPIIITNSIFDNNRSPLQGGAIRVSSADLTITDTSFTNNQIKLTSDNSTDTTGNSDAGGAAIAFVNHLNDSGNILTISKGTFTGNQASGFGGAILIRGAKTASISQSTFTNNITNNFISNAVTQAYGGAIALDRQANVTIDDSLFTGNTAQRSGGAIYVGNIHSDGTLNVTSSNLINNTATENGAAIYIDATQDYTTSISQTSLNTNNATGNGGALYVNEKLLNLTIENTTISANTANQGAGIYFEDAVIDGSQINHSSIIANVSTTGAGAIQATSTPLISLNHDIISGNTGTVRQACIEDAQTGFDITYSLINEVTSDDGCAAYMADGNSIVSATDPLLGPLANNGGKGQTHYPADNSPVIDIGDSTLEGVPDVDQRGSARVTRGIIDMGAVEFGNLAQNDAKEIPNATLSPTNEYSQIITGFFTQPENDTLTYAIVGDLPAGLVFDSTTNTISGTPEYTGDGVTDFYTTVTVNATANTSGNTSQSTYTLTVGYSAPVYEGLTSLAVKINSGLSWDLAKSTDIDNQAITYSLSGLPEGLSFDGNNFVVGRTTQAMVANSPYTLELQSIDEYDTTNTQITLKIIDPDDVVIITDTESGAASLNIWLLSGLALIGLGGFRRRKLNECNLLPS